MSRTDVRKVPAGSLTAPFVSAPERAMRSPRRFSAEQSPLLRPRTIDTRGARRPPETAHRPVRPRCDEQ